MRLVVDGQVVRSATGNDSEALERASWDVSDLRPTARRVWRSWTSTPAAGGHILVDHVVLTDRFTPADAPAKSTVPAALPPDAALHVGGAFALAIEPMAATFETPLSREHPHRVITLDPNIRPMLIDDHTTVRARLRRWLGMTDIVKVSADDLRWIAPDRSLADVVSEWHELGPALVIVTRGAKGVYASGPTGHIDLPALPVDITDTVGTGDAFMAGLLQATPSCPDNSRPTEASSLPVDVK